MEVIFLKDVKGQAKKGDVKKVKDGYAINFLIKNNLAVAKTDKGLEILNKEKALEKEKEDANLLEATQLKNKLEKETISFKIKTGDMDKVFGSISTKQIKEELDKLGYNINKNQIVLDHAISNLGVHNVEIVLYKKVKAIIKVKVTK